jgi:hypothetical protein
MRKMNGELRARYIEVGEELSAHSQTPTVEAFACILGIPYGTARNYFFRHPVLAKRLGLSIRDNAKPIDYLRAAQELDRRNEKITGHTLAAHLGKNYSAVYRFLRNHPGIRARIYETTGALIGKAEPPEFVIPRSDIRHLEHKK